MPEPPFEIPDLDQFRREFYGVVRQRPDIGAAKIMGDCVFKPCRLFDSEGRRKLKPEILIVLGYLLLMIVAIATFNLR